MPQSTKTTGAPVQRANFITQAELEVVHKAQDVIDTFQRQALNGARIQVGFMSVVQYKGRPRVIC